MSNHLIDFRLQLLAELKAALQDSKAAEKVAYVRLANCLAGRAYAAVADAHREEFINRDIKPSDTLLAGAPGLGEVLQILDCVAVQGPATANGDDWLSQLRPLMIGPPAYMSPEQLTGVAAVHSDTCSLGPLLMGLGSTDTLDPHWQHRPELDELVEWWSSSSSERTCLLVGEGGTGKTSLSRALLTRISADAVIKDPKDGIQPSRGTSREHRSAKRVFVFSFGASISPRAFKDSLRSLHSWLRASTQTENTSGLLRGASHSLVILDGLDDANEAGRLREAATLKRLIRFVTRRDIDNIKLLVSSRQPPFSDRDLPRSFCRTIRLGGLSETSAIRLLRASGVRQGTTQQLAAMAREARCHPLLLELIGAYTSRFCAGNPGTLRHLSVSRSVVSPGHVVLPISVLGTWPAGRSSGVRAEGGANPGSVETGGPSAVNILAQLTEQDPAVGVILTAVLKSQSSLGDAYLEIVMRRGLLDVDKQYPGLLLMMIVDALRAEEPAFRQTLAVVSKLAAYICDAIASYELPGDANILRGIDELGGLYGVADLALNAFINCDPSLRLLERLVQDRRPAYDRAKWFANRLGIDVCVEDTPDLPACLVKGQRTKIIFLDSGLSDELKTWAVCHEVAHLVLGHTPDTDHELNIDGLVGERRAQFDRQERAADAVASWWNHLLECQTKQTLNSKPSGLGVPSSDKSGKERRRWFSYASFKSAYESMRQKLDGQMDACNGENQGKVLWWFADRSNENSVSQGRGRVPSVMPSGGQRLALGQSESNRLLPVPTEVMLHLEASANRLVAHVATNRRSSLRASRIGCLEQEIDKADRESRQRQREPAKEPKPT